MAKRSANWTTDEEMVLVEEVGKREGVLFGKMKGDGCVKIGEIRNRGWQEIADVLNARFSFRKRGTQEIKKKFYNIKQRSKEKLDQIKRPKTGGGQCVTMSSSEELLLETMEGRPQIEGLTCGIDTDDTSCTSPTDEPHVHGIADDKEETNKSSTTDVTEKRCSRNEQPVTFGQKTAEQFHSSSCSHRY